MVTKEYILKGIKYMEGTKPSKWNAAMVMGLKMNFLPRLKSFITGEEFEEKEDIVSEAEKIFEVR